MEVEHEEPNRICVLSLLRQTRSQSKIRHNLPLGRRGRKATPSEQLVAAIDYPSKAEFRIAKDMEEIKNDKWCARGTSVTVKFPSKRLKNFLVKITPAEGFYVNGQFHFNVDVPDNYPFTAPRIHCLDKVFHPNFDPKTGELGLPVLSVDWTPVLSMNDVLLAMQLLFCEPNVPNKSDASDKNNNNNNNNNGNHNSSKTNRNINAMDRDDNNIDNIDNIDDNDSMLNEDDDCMRGPQEQEVEVILNREACEMYQADVTRFEQTVQEIIHGHREPEWPCLLPERYQNKQGNRTYRSHSLKPMSSVANGGFDSYSRSMTPQTGGIHAMHGIHGIHGIHGMHGDIGAQAAGHCFTKTDSVLGKRNFRQMAEGSADSVENAMSALHLNHSAGAKRDGTSWGNGNLKFVDHDDTEIADFIADEWMPPKKRLKTLNDSENWSDLSKLSVSNVSNVWNDCNVSNLSNASHSSNDSNVSNASSNTSNMSNSGTEWNGWGSNGMQATENEMKNSTSVTSSDNRGFGGFASFGGSAAFTGFGQVTGFGQANGSSPFKGFGTWAGNNGSSNIGGNSAGNRNDVSMC